MDQQGIFELAEKKLSKFVRNFEKTNAYDYSSLQKFKNLIECIPGIEETKEFQELLGRTEDIIYCGSHGGQKTSTQKFKIDRIMETFLIIKYETLKPEERDSPMGENIFLTICAFAWVMLMFAP